MSRKDVTIGWRGCQKRPEQQQAGIILHLYKYKTSKSHEAEDVLLLALGECALVLRWWERGVARGVMLLGSQDEQRMWKPRAANVSSHTNGKNKYESPPAALCIRLTDRIARLDFLKGVQGKPEHQRRVSVGARSRAPSSPCLKR